MGSLIFNKNEIQALKSHNAKDLRLWNHFVVPTYDQTKREILKEYSITQEHLDIVVSQYKQAVQRHQEYIHSLRNLTAIVANLRRMLLLPVSVQSQNRYKEVYSS
jgi:hypothetical protein